MCIRDSTDRAQPIMTGQCTVVIERIPLPLEFDNRAVISITISGFHINTLVFPCLLYTSIIGCKAESIATGNGRFQLSRPTDRQRRFGQERIGSLIGRFKVDPTPVSYTHLDVYKRQGINFRKRGKFYIL